MFSLNLLLFLSAFIEYDLVQQGFWRGNVPALLMYMPYAAIQFTVLHKLKTFAAGSSKTGMIHGKEYGLGMLQMSMTILYFLYQIFDLSQYHLLLL